jgi:hypothetical protein
MLSLEVRELAEQFKNLSLEEQQWLLQQLMEQMSNASVTPSTEKIFNITPSTQGSGYQDTAINHDLVFVNHILNNDD